MDVKRYRPFHIWTSNFSDKRVFVPKGMLDAHLTETPGEVYALRNPPVNDMKQEEHTSPLLPVEYQDADCRATQILKHAEVAESDESKLSEYST